MAEFIYKADALNVNFRISVNIFESRRETAEKAVQAYADEIAKIPSADVRPVVRGKDCKYYYKDADGYEMCDNSECYDHVTEDGFCAWAKKREES